MSFSLDNLLSVASLMGPLPDAGKINPNSPNRTFASFKIASARDDNGTRYSRAAFMRAPEMVHVRVSRLTSSHVASLTSRAAPPSRRLWVKMD